MSVISYAARFRQLALDDPDRPQVSDARRTWTRSELDLESDALAHHLRDLGVAADDFVTICLPTGGPFVRALMACWKLGAIPQPVSSRLPAPELSAICQLASPTAVIGAAEGMDLGATAVSAEWDPASIALTDRSPLQDHVSPAWKAPTSGGSTGRPKLIVSGDPSLLDPDAEPILLIRRNGTLVMPGPLYHNGPLSWAAISLLAGGHVVVFDRFDPMTTLAAIETHSADMVYLVPTMMRRIWRLAPDDRESFDLSCLKVVWHLAEPCPTWLKDAWIEWLGPKRIWELYAGTENQASTVIRGDQWLTHRGSVGRTTVGEMIVLSASGVPVPAGIIGEIFMRRGEGIAAPYRYVGADAKTLATDELGEGWESLGDMGWMDDEGYLYLADRATDMILSGGANIYPAEIEAALCEHSVVESAAVIGLPDDDLGNVVHAIVQVAATSSADANPGELIAELLSFCGERLVRYKVPRSMEFVTEPLRDEAGKVRRSQLRAERLVSRGVGPSD